MTDTASSATLTGSSLILAPGRAQIEVAYGNRFGCGAEEHWFSAGLHMFSPRFLP